MGSTDERFRPVFISNAPDGTLMIVDFYRGVIQDRASTTLYLKDYIQKRKLDAPIGVGMYSDVPHPATASRRPRVGSGRSGARSAARRQMSGWLATS